VETTLEFGRERIDGIELGLWKWRQWGVKLFLDKGADITAAENDRWTAVDSASENGHIEVAKVLLEREPMLQLRITVD
jgi:hypothetical protein